MGHTDVIESTITYAQTDSTIDINAVDLDSNSAFHYAVRGSHLDIISALIAADQIDLNIQDYLQRTPLHWTIMWNRFKAASFLVNDKRIKLDVLDKFEETPLCVALSNGRSRLAVLLMEHEAWPKRELAQQALSAAVLGGGGVVLCEQLVREAGADPVKKAAWGEGPYHLADFAGNKEAAGTILRLCEERERSNDRT